LSRDLLLEWTVNIISNYELGPSNPTKTINDNVSRIISYIAISWIPKKKTKKEKKKK